MSFQSAPNCAEAVLQATIGSQQIANVLNFWKPTGYDQADLDALSNAVDARVGSDYLPLVSSGVSYNQTLVRGLENIIDLQSADGTNAGPGTAAGTGIPANNTFCITLRTGLTGRSARGRFYAWPTVASNYTAPSLLSVTYANALVAFLDAVQVDAFALGWNFVVLSRYSLGAKRTVAIHNNVIANVARNLIGDSQRHRLPRGH